MLESVILFMMGLGMLRLNNWARLLSLANFLFLMFILSASLFIRMKLGGILLYILTFTFGIFIFYYLNLPKVWQQFNLKINLKNKIFNGIKLLAWTIIVSNFIILFYNWLYSTEGFNFNLLYSSVLARIFHLVSSFALYPASFIPILQNKIPEIVLFKHNLGIIWAMIIIICSFGVLQLKNLARIVLAIFCSIQCIVSSFAVISSSALFLHLRNFAIFKAILKASYLAILFKLLPAIIAFLYIIYLFRPKVFKQFK